MSPQGRGAPPPAYALSADHRDDLEFLALRLARQKPRRVAPFLSVYTLEQNPARPPKIAFDHASFHLSQIEICEIVNYGIANISISIQFRSVSFPAAYSAALRRADISRVNAAAKAMLDPAIITRILKGDQRAQPEHLRAMLSAIDDPQDRDNCLLFWVKDQLDPKDAARLTLLSDRLEEPATVYLDRIRDELDEAADIIRRAAANGNPAARRAMIALARAVDEDEPPDKLSRPSGAGPARSLSESA